MNAHALFANLMNELHTTLKHDLSFFTLLVEENQRESKHGHLRPVTIYAES